MLRLYNYAYFEMFCKKECHSKLPMATHLHAWHISHALTSCVITTTHSHDDITLGCPEFIDCSATHSQGDLKWNIHDCSCTTYSQI